MYIVFSVPNCRYCVEACSILEFSDLEYEKRLVKKDFWKSISYKTGGRKMYPIIFLNDIYIGGCDDLFLLLNGTSA